METIKQLLNNISIISRKYEEIAKTTGENFNVFKILNLTTNETRTHSAFLAELLNPKGTHGLGNIMLKHFKEIIEFTDLDLETASIHIERGIGYVSQDYSEGGRIDIIIKDNKGNGVIIENKIYAGDQYKQLERYNDYARKKYKKWKLLYLTLDGKLANTSLENGNDYTCISYKNDITEWLEKCKKEAASFPLLRETIAQYLVLIKNLTNQSINKKMENEIVEYIIANGNNVKGSFEITNSLEKIKQALLRKFAKQLEDKIIKYNPEIIVEVSSQIGKQYNGVTFKLPQKQNEFILFSFLSDYRDCYLEVVNLNNNKSVKNKKQENIEYYKNKLKGYTNSWGKIENVENAWHGDWVCRYSKVIISTEFLVDIADNNFEKKVDDVTEDINVLIKAIKEKTF
ncbi:MAG: PD-(D/E)XK nuclease family protein [Bacteroidetes bacterium]|nr:PD-(D/E)XK nuclease family protein [Bacteroidota bacterium]MBS1670965.1 PD-(D/E)XK nuclease family protein [Bacteroidota bacterium]